jgi:hypothetical protein
MRRSQNLACRLHKLPVVDASNLYHFPTINPLHLLHVARACV